MEYDLHNNVDEKLAFGVQEVISDTTTAGNIIDTAGFESIEFVITTKTVTDGVYTVKLEDGDDSGLSDAADVDSTLVLGTLPSFVLTDDDTIKRVGCISKKRYVRLSIVSTGTTSGVDAMTAVAVLGHPHRAPVAQ